MKLTPEELAESRAIFKRGVAEAQKVLKPGDRIRSNRGCGPYATYTFTGWDGDWIKTKSGYNDIAATNIKKVNGEAMTFPGAA
jgi:hypothetical protein